MGQFSQLIIVESLLTGGGYRSVILTGLVSTDTRHVYISDQNVTASLVSTGICIIT